ncbi:MAG TPA: hypothetical protein VL381_09900, partial [Rhodocyclaceae bacterium]|nr:hypothetical protein [Rhodocyclaceae bacterium]
MNEELNELASAYVLGTLSAERRAEVERQLISDIELRRAVDYWEAKLLPLTNLAPPMEPSRQLWPRIQNTLQLGRAGVTAAVTWWNNLTLWRSLSVGGFATAAILAFVVSTQAPPQPRYMVVLVAPQDKNPGWVIQANTNNSLKL